MKNRIKNLFQILVEILLIPYILYKALVSHFTIKKIEVGLGPQPLINNIYHKKALELYGYSTETFVSNPFYITKEFDIVLSERYNIKTVVGRFQAFLVLIDLAFKYNILYFYFYGGPLGVSTKVIWRFEAIFYRIAKVKTVIMPYGSDIQDMSRTKNLYFKHALNQDYPKHKKNNQNTKQRIDYWTKNANHVISGCEWVDYMYGWDTLMLAHFSIDVSRFDSFKERERKSDSFKVFHAPNHKCIKGSKHLISAVNELIKEGYNIELVMLNKVSNTEIIKAIQSVDLVADQFVIGWYAMFALEAMSLKKPVLCYLRDDLVELYIKAGLINKDEIPILNTNLLGIKDKLIWAYNNRNELLNIGKKSKEYVLKHHSIEVVGSVFDEINKKIMEK